MFIDFNYIWAKWLNKILELDRDRSLQLQLSLEPPKELQHNDVNHTLVRLELKRPKINNVLTQRANSKKR
jgi:hypothetical protein